MIDPDLPARGEVWLVALGAARRGEPGKHRPAVVMSATELHVGRAHDLVVVVPISSSVPTSELRHPVSLAEGADRPSLALPRSIRAVTPDRLVQRLGVLEPETMRAISGSLRLILGLGQ